jgi:hypothetical protein
VVEAGTQWMPRFLISVHLCIRGDKVDHKPQTAPSALYTLPRHNDPG